MKYTAISISLLFFLVIAQSQQAEPVNTAEFSEDVEFLKTFGTIDNEDPNTLNSTEEGCYTFMLGDVKQDMSGRLEIDINVLRRALAAGPSVVAGTSCKAVASVENMRMLVIYNNDSEIEYPVEKLSEMRSNPGISERLLFDAREVKFVDIQIKDADGMEHNLGDQTFFILS